MQRLLKLYMKKLLEFFYELLHKLEANNATLVTEYKALVIFKKELSENVNSMTEYTYNKYLEKYFPLYIDKASCISMTAYLTPRLKQDIIRTYRDIRGIEKEIFENAKRWNIEITLTSLRQYKSGEEPFIFDSEYEDQPMEQWELISMYSDSKFASNLCEFYRILCSISPTETVVERAFSIEKFIHSSTRNRLSSERVEDIMTYGRESLNLNKHGVRYEMKCLFIKLNETYSDSGINNLMEEFRPLFPAIHS